MDNQHRKIVGYRELIPEEIDLMNRIKAAGKQLLDLQAELVGRLNTDYEIKFNAAKVSTEGQISLMGTPYGPFTGATDECIEFRRSTTLSRSAGQPSARPTSRPASWPWFERWPSLRSDRQSASKRNSLRRVFFCQNNSPTS